MLRHRAARTFGIKQTANDWLRSVNNDPRFRFELVLCRLSTLGICSAIFPHLCEFIFNAIHLFYCISEHMRSINFCIDFSVVTAVTQSRVVCKCTEFDLNLTVFFGYFCIIIVFPRAIWCHQLFSHLISAQIHHRLTNALDQIGEYNIILCFSFLISARVRGGWSSKAMY